MVQCNVKITKQLHIEQWGGGQGGRVSGMGGVKGCKKILNFVNMISKFIIESYMIYEHPQDMTLNAYAI